MQGVLDVKGRNSLSRVVFYCFIPSLTFTKLAASVDLANMGRWWFLPVNVLLRCACFEPHSEVCMLRSSHDAISDWVFDTHPSL